MKCTSSAKSSFWRELVSKIVARRRFGTSFATSQIVMPARQTRQARKSSFDQSVIKD
jgi:hypothetical protein